MTTLRTMLGTGLLMTATAACSGGVDADRADATRACVETGPEEVTDGGETLLIRETLAEESVEHTLAIGLPDTWCPVSRPPTDQAFDGSIIAGMRFAGPVTTGSPPEYPTLEVTGMWNGDLEITPAVAAESMTEELDGDWTEWSGVDVDGAAGLVRTNQDPAARDEVQLMMTTEAADWVVSLRSYELTATQVTELAQGLTAATEPAES